MLRKYCIEKLVSIFSELHQEILFYRKELEDHVNISEEEFSTLNEKRKEICRKLEDAEIKEYSTAFNVASMEFITEEDIVAIENGSGFVFSRGHYYRRNPNISDDFVKERCGVIPLKLNFPPRTGGTITLEEYLSEKKNKFNMKVVLFFEECEIRLKSETIVSNRIKRWWVGEMWKPFSKVGKKRLLRSYSSEDYSVW